MSLSNRSKPAFFSAFLKAVKLQQKGLLQTATQYFTVALNAAADNAHLFKAECCLNLATCFSAEGSFEDAATCYYKAGIQFQRLNNASRAIEAFSGAIQALESQEETEHLQLQIAQCSYDILQLLKKEKDKNWKRIAEHLLKINYVSTEELAFIDGFDLAKACQDAADQYLLEDSFDEAMSYYGVAKQVYDRHSRMHRVEECEKKIESAIFLSQLKRLEDKASLQDASKKESNDSFSSLTSLGGASSMMVCAETDSESSEAPHHHEVSRNTPTRSQ